MKLTVTTNIHAPLSTVWEAFWKPEHIVHWCFASDDWHCPRAVGEEPKIDGIFTNTFAAKDGSFAFDLVGKYDEVIPLQKLVYTMGEMKEYFLPAGRQVEVLLSPLLLGESKGEVPCVQITETFDAEDIHSAGQQIEGWQAILENLKKYVESLA